jgi:hypothetical protein
MFAHINETLASIAATVDSLPFVNIPDTVFAVSPFRIRSDSREKEFSIYGFFPSVVADVKAVKVTVDGKEVKFYRGVGKIAFDLSDDVMKSPNAILDVAIQLPRKHWYSFEPTPIHAKLRKLSATPYAFVVDVFKHNAAAYETVVGNKYSQYADKDENPFFSAEQLFNLTVPADVRTRYDTTSTQITNLTINDRKASKPCGNCPDPDGIIKTWDAGGVTLQMKAPSCPYKLMSCGGGGSNFYLIFTPTFTVRIKGAVDSVADFSKNLNVGWNSVNDIDLTQDWTSAVVKLHYDNNFDSRDEMLAAKRGVPIAAATQFDLRVENNKLYISTH